MVDVQFSFKKYGFKSVLHDKNIVHWNIFFLKEYDKLV